MEKELCFVIEGTKLYLEQVLVDYNEIPVFYVCSSDMGWYLVLCTDIDKQIFYVVKVKLLTISDLLEKNITMRGALLSGSLYWEIFAADQVEDDVVNSLKRQQICAEYLPKEGAFFSTFSEELRAYKERVQRKLFEGNDWKVDMDNLKNGYEELLPTDASLTEISKGLSTLGQYLDNTISYKENTECILQVNAITVEEISPVDVKRLDFSNDTKMSVSLISMRDTQNDVIDTRDSSRLVAA